MEQSPHFREQLIDRADSVVDTGRSMLCRKGPALSDEAVENFRTYVAILREWDQRQRSNDTSTVDV